MELICDSGKRCYFCTRNNGIVLTTFWNKPSQIRFWKKSWKKIWIVKNKATIFAARKIREVLKKIEWWFLKNGLEINRKKIQKKLARIKKRFYFCNPQTEGSSFEILVKTEGKFFQKKVSKSFAGLKRSSTFAPASWEGSNKQRRHVHRHIELTALNRSNPVQK